MYSKELYGIALPWNKNIEMPHFLEIMVLGVLFFSLIRWTVTVCTLKISHLTLLLLGSRALMGRLSFRNCVVFCSMQTHLLFYYWFWLLKQMHFSANSLKHACLTTMHIPNFWSRSHGSGCVYLFFFQHMIVGASLYEWASIWLLFISSWC